MSSIISALSPTKLIHKGPEAFLAYIVDTRAYESKLDHVPIILEYVDIFPKELSRLPPDRELEFAIDMVPRSTSKSMAPYRMALIELNKLKI